MSNMISIIIPCYNVGKYVKKTIDSVLAQTYSNIELILVDDGSTDETAFIIDEAAERDNRIHIIHKNNGGVTSARLTGIKASKGEWIGFVDGDDYIEPNMYERLIKNAMDYNADISHCGYQMIFPNHTDYYYDTKRLVIQDNENGLKDLLSGSFIEPGLCNKLYHATLFQRLLHDELMDTSIKNNEDLLMNYYLFRFSKKSIFEDVCLYHYILRKNSATSSEMNKNQLLDPLKVLKIIKDDSNNKKLINIIDKRILAHLLRLSTLSVNNSKNNKKLIKSIKADAQKELCNMLLKVMKGNYSNKIKFFSIWCAIWPWSYSVVHDIYATLKGTKHKYDI